MIVPARFLNKYEFTLPAKYHWVEDSLVTDGRDKTRTVVEPPGQSWVFMVTFMWTDDPADYFVHRRQHRHGTPFAMPVPQMPSLNLPSANVAVTGVAGQTSLSASGNTRIEKGLFFTIPGHRKLYQVDRLRTSGAIQIFPALRQNVNTAQTLNFEPTMWSLYDTAGDGSLSWEENSLLRISFTAREALT